ncbi:cytidine deaminase [Mangrovibacter sp. SLW1]
MHPRFVSAFETLPATLRTSLQPLLEDSAFPAMLTSEQTQHLRQQTGMDNNALAFALLPLAAACAWTGISHFNVGAIVHGTSGALWFGANMEFPGSSMQQTIHAEQSAISHAWMGGEQALSGITVNYTPCGHCRQFMNELNSGLSLEIHLPEREPATLGNYLPDAFGPKDLAITTLLLDNEDHSFPVTGSALEQSAITAANRSHCPYSQSPGGVALQTHDGSLFAGSYAENAAFNPSLPPLQVALNLLRLRGYRAEDIAAAAIAERENGQISHHDSTVSLLHTLGCQNITLVTLV